MLKTVSQSGGGTTGAVVYQGTWNASTNVPTLVSSVGTKGYYYLVSVAGSTNLNGITTWNAGDWAVFDGTVWERVIGGTPSTSFTLGNTVVTLGGTTTNVGNLGLANTNITSVATTFPNSYLANSSSTLGNTLVTLGSTVNNIGNLTLANVTILSGKVPNSAVTGLGTMATQNANAIAVTGGSINGTAIGQSSPGDGTFGILVSDKSSANAYAVGTLPYTPANALLIAQSSATSFNQIIISNTNNVSNTASTDYIVNNFNSTDSTYYGDFGMNGSQFAGSGPFNQPNNVYLTATTADLAIGTTTANAVHFVTNSSVTDAMTINSNNTVTIASLISSNVSIVGGSINVTTVNKTSNTASNVTYTSATMQLVPAGYINYLLNGVLVKIPYYNA